MTDVLTATWMALLATGIVLCLINAPLYRHPQYDGIYTAGFLCICAAAVVALINAFT